MARVLHIEDDASNRLLVRRLLEAAGHEVVDAEGGLEGLRLAASSSPDLVLVDIDIPGLDGYEVTLRLRDTAGTASIPIIAITAEGDRDTSLAVGADGFIQKPIDVRGFADTVAEFLGGRSERSASAVEDVLRSQSRRLAERLEAKVVELSAANRRLEELAHLRSEFLRNLSHEFATPMTPIVGYLRLLLDEELGPLTALQRKCLESINTSTRKLKRLIDTLLDVSHLETGRLHVYRRAYDFSQVVERAIADTRDVFTDRGVELLCEALDEPRPAEGDPDKLTRAVMHVLDNAAKFTPRGAAVGIAIRKREDLEHAAYDLIVADSGPGITEQDQRRILEPFFQVDGTPTRAHGGVGLGLAFARHVSEALGGGIEIHSPPHVEVAGRKLPGSAVTLRVRTKPGRESGPDA